MVVKMVVVGPIAELTEEACSGPSCALLRHRRGRDERDFGSLGVESVQPPAAALKMQCGDQARAGIRDPWERNKIILNQRGQSVKIGTGKQRITASGAFLKPRKLLLGVGTLTHAGDFAASGVSMYLGRSVRDQLRHVRNLPKQRVPLDHREPQPRIDRTGGSASGVPGIAPDVVVMRAGELAASHEFRNERLHGFFRWRVCVDRGLHHGHVDQVIGHVK